MSTLFDAHIVSSSSSLTLSSLSLLALSPILSINTDILIDSISIFDHIVNECHKNTNVNVSYSMLKKCSSILADIFAFISIEIIGIIILSISLSLF